MTGQTLALDPGPTHTGWALIADTDCRPLAFGKDSNDDMPDTLLVLLLSPTPRVAIEQIGHYGTGMPAGRDVFDTCRWIGRYEQTLADLGCTPHLVLRAKIKTHLCGSPRAKDGSVIQALVDRFAPGQPNKGKGTKAAPGWFHGFAGDVWQAMALAVYAVDKAKAGEPL